MQQAVLRLQSRAKMETTMLARQRRACLCKAVDSWLNTKAERSRCRRGFEKLTLRINKAGIHKILETWKAHLEEARHESSTMCTMQERELLNERLRHSEEQLTLAKTQHQQLQRELDTAHAAADSQASETEPSPDTPSAVHAQRAGKSAASAGNAPRGGLPLSPGGGGGAAAATPSRGATLEEHVQLVRQLRISEASKDQANVLLEQARRFGEEEKEKNYQMAQVEDKMRVCASH